MPRVRIVESLLDISIYCITRSMWLNGSPYFKMNGDAENQKTTSNGLRENVDNNITNLFQQMRKRKKYALLTDTRL
jgi:hypothetical protein